MTRMMNQVGSRRWLVLAALAVGLGAMAARAEDGASTQPALPPGHPTVGEGLPAGHPAVPGAETPALPSGHPQVGGGAGGGGLPAGHPGVAGGGGGGPVIDPKVKGVLQVKVGQASKGGPAIGEDAVVVDYYDLQGNAVGKTEGKLDKNSELTITDVPAGLGIQPVVAVQHGGVTYRAAAEFMDANRRQQVIEMRVFESTELEPDWRIQMRHVILSPSQSGVAVTEMLSVYNPTDRSWLGVETAGGAKASVIVQLPAGAKNVEFSPGLSETDGKVMYRGAMQPGTAEFQFSYFLPAVDDGAEVKLVAPTATGSIYVFMPDDGSTVTSEQIKKVDVKSGMSLREGSRFFTALPQKRGEVIAIRLGGLKGLKAVTPPPVEGEAK